LGWYYVGIQGQDGSLSDGMRIVVAGLLGRWMIVVMYADVGGGGYDDERSLRKT